jgi:lipoprotein-anchoring transpeptidase ErfK/SrfK
MRATWYGRIATLMLGLAFSASRVESQVVDSARAFTIHVSIGERRLRVVDANGDTVRNAPIAVGSGRTLRADTLTWTFVTPTGVTRVSAKEQAPLWVPPDWYYLELAERRGLRLERLGLDTPFVVRRDLSVVVRNWQVGTLGRDSVFRPFPAGTDVIVGGILFIPPFGTAQRKLPGILGAYRLRLANGIGLHGTPDEDSIGKAATHGCIRLYDTDIAWLYDNVPVGTAVIIR